MRLAWRGFKRADSVKFGGFESGEEDSSLYNEIKYSIILFH